MNALRLPDESDALALALAAAQSAGDDAGAAILLALESGDWPAALAALDALASALAGALEGPLLAAALLGMGRVEERLPAYSVPSQQPTRPAPFLEVLQRQLAGLPEDLRAQFVAALAREHARVIAGASAGAGAGAGAAERPLPPEVEELELPLAKAAAEALLKRKLVSHEQLRQMGEDARGRALAVAGVAREGAARRLHEVLAEEVREGPSLSGFRRRAREEQIELTSPAALEATFRDAVQTAYADGMEALLNDPVVGDALPYVETLPIRDSRLSSMCARAARSGIQGTAIYRRDDPAWQATRPPRHPNCRCGTNPLTVAMAAEKGIREAREWLRTGRPPAGPARVAMPDLAGR